MEKKETFIELMSNFGTDGNLEKLFKSCKSFGCDSFRLLLNEGHVVNERFKNGESWLSLGCSAGYLELVQVLLAGQADIEGRDTKEGCTPLMEAASAGFVNIVKLLLANKAKVNASSSKFGHTSLMYACAGGHVDVVKELLNHGANIDAHNNFHHTALMEAASAGHIMVATILIEHGAKVYNSSGLSSPTALLLACYKGNLKMLKFLLEVETDHENEENKNHDMHIVLNEASSDGNYDMAKLVLDFGAPLNILCGEEESPLTFAICGGHIKLALLLIERGANIEETNSEDFTPLMVAVQESEKAIVYVLLKKGANLDAFNDATLDSSLTLMLGDIGLLHLSEFLITHCAFLMFEKTTILIEAAIEGDLKVVRYLLTCGANANAKTALIKGDTPLTLACANGHTQVAELLIQFGATVNYRAESGSPMTNASRKGYIETVIMLMKHGALIDF